MKTQITRLTSSSALMTISLLLWGSSALASTLLVDDNKTECPDAGFNTIQAAVDAAMSGDTIQVCTGTYDEQVEIAKPLTLEGIVRDGKNAAVVQPSHVVANSDFNGTPNATMILVQDTSGVTIRNIAVDGIKNGVVCSGDFPLINGIFFPNASGKVESVVIKNLLSPAGCAFGDALDILSTDGGGLQVTVKDSSIHDYDANGIFSDGAGVSLSAIKTVVTGLGASASYSQAGINLVDGATVRIEGNIVTNHFNPDCPNCIFYSSNIAFSGLEDASVIGNVIGRGNFGIQGDGNRVSYVNKTVFDSTGANGFLVVGDDNVFKDNRITNSVVALFVQGANNTIQGNTINEAEVGLLVSPGNNILANQFSNTLRTKSPLH